MNITKYLSSQDWKIFQLKQKRPRTLTEAKASYKTHPVEVFRSFKKIHSNVTTKALLSCGFKAVAGLFWMSLVTLTSITETDETIFAQTSCCCWSTAQFTRLIPFSVTVGNGGDGILYTQKLYKNHLKVTKHYGNASCLELIATCWVGQKCFPNFNSNYVPLWGRRRINCIRQHVELGQLYASHSRSLVHTEWICMRGGDDNSYYASWWL